MKIISLNTWGGQEHEALMGFIGEHMRGTDIFCFQEVTTSKNDLAVSNNTRTNLFREISELLVGFAGRLETFESGFDEAGPVDFDIRWGQAIFVKESIKTIQNDFITTFDGSKWAKGEIGARSILQHVRLQRGRNQLTVCNIHGLPYPGNKLDNSERLKQSRRIKAFTDGVDGPLILCGDFNLLPETESIKMLGENLRNLISEFHVKETRSSLSSYYNGPDYQPFADYTFVSKYIDVATFSVPQVRVSDHLPMILQFEP